MSLQFIASMNHNSSQADVESGSYQNQVALFPCRIGYGSGHLVCVTFSRSTSKSAITISFGYYFFDNLFFLRLEFINLV